MPEGVWASVTAVAAAFVSSEPLLVYENYVCGTDISGQSRSVTRTHKSPPLSGYVAKSKERELITECKGVSLRKRWDNQMSHLILFK